MKESKKLILRAGSGDEFAIISSDKEFYLGYCSRSSVVKVAQGFDRARGLLFRSPGELHYIDDAGVSVSIPASILLRETLNVETCPLKVG